MPFYVHMFSNDVTAVSMLQECFLEDLSNDKEHHWEGNYLLY